MTRVLELMSYAREGLKFCPRCGGPLERNQISNARSCFNHGDFIVLWEDDSLRVQWRATRMSGKYTNEPTPEPTPAEQVAKYFPENNNDNVVYVGPDWYAAEIQRRFLNGTYTLIEAWQLSHWVRNEQPPMDPSHEDIKAFLAKLSPEVEDGVVITTPIEQDDAGEQASE